MASSLSLFESSFFRASDPTQHENVSQLRTEPFLYQPEVETITILRPQYEALLRTAQQFENLKHSLLKGGVAREDLNLLIHESPLPIPGPAANTHFQRNQTQENEFQSNRKNGARWTRSDDLKTTGGENGFCIFDKEEIYSPEREETRQDSTTNEQRSVDIQSIPDRATHLDLTNAICGGAILELYVKFFDRSARLSFTEPSAARAFVDNAKQHGFYVAGKKVEISWAERQLFLRPFIKQNINNGASRNLVIRNITPNITEALIREHLDHIHNLVVIDIKFNGKNAFVSTNSVHNAMYARSCMMSRTTYKRMRIEYSQDECIRPFPEVENDQKSKKTVEHTPKLVSKPKKSLSNRFEVLNFETSEESDESGITDTSRSRLTSRGRDIAL